MADENKPPEITEPPPTKTDNQPVVPPQTPAPPTPNTPATPSTPNTPSKPKKEKSKPMPTDRQVEPTKPHQSTPHKESPRKRGFFDWLPDL